MSPVPNSKPWHSGFNPRVIPYQWALHCYLRDFDYSIGNPEILCSGSFGSAKSIMGAHLAINHCLTYPRSRVLLARRSMPDLKETIYKEIVEHIELSGQEENGTPFIEGLDYWKRDSTGYIRFRNGSEIISRSWADRKYHKFRSLKISACIMEELVENDKEDAEAFKMIKARLRRLPHVPVNWFLGLTNPDEPDHWAHEYFIEGENKYETRKVFYSNTRDNPFLDNVYIDQLIQDMTVLEKERYIDGRWNSLKGKVIYYEYDSKWNHIRAEYEIDPHYPVVLFHDFNIGDGKPMSMGLGQYIDDYFHIFADVIIHSARTDDIMDELFQRELIRPDLRYQLEGDSAGRARDTRGTRSDWGIIKDRLDEAGITYEYKVPRKNPPIRRRHNAVNAFCRNAQNKRRLFTYKGAERTHKGLLQTKLKKGGDYVEDDTKELQHVTTGLGYWVDRVRQDNTRTKTKWRQT
jgi:hypothetical protein